MVVVARPEANLPAFGLTFLGRLGERIVVGVALAQHVGPLGAPAHDKSGRQGDGGQARQTDGPNSRQPATSTTAAIDSGRKTFQPRRISWSYR